MATGRDEVRDRWTARIREHDHRVVVALLALGLDLERAREIAQATWTRLIERDRQGALGEVRLPGLALAQARFFALDHLRAERRFGEAGDRELAVDHLDPERTAIDRERLSRALGVLAGCSPNARRVFQLVYAEAASHDDVARTLGISLQRVRQIVCEVRKAVRAALEEETP
jgi:RNA polymerase sigma-70 factor (ECF subfamily)